MSTQQKTKILRMLSMQPCALKAFTEGDLVSTVSNRHIERYLGEMLDDGLIEHRGDKYYITEDGLAKIADQPGIVPSRIYTHAASTQPYVPPKWNSPRPGADDHKRYSSRGLG